MKEVTGRKEQAPLRRGLFIISGADLLSHTGVTGILSGSLQKVTIDRVLRLVEAANLVAEMRVKAAA